MRLRAELQEAEAPVTGYVPAHALRQVDLRVVANEADDYAEASYGDFDSYASLALATAR